MPSKQLVTGSNPVGDTNFKINRDKFQKCAIINSTGDVMTEEECLYVMMIEHQMNNLPQHYSVMGVDDGYYGYYVHVSFWVDLNGVEQKVQFVLHRGDYVPTTHLRFCRIKYDNNEKQWKKDYINTIVPKTIDECKSVEYFTVPFLQYLFSVLQ